MKTAASLINYMNVGNGFIDRFIISIPNALACLDNTEAEKRCRTLPKLGASYKLISDNVKVGDGSPAKVFSFSMEAQRYYLFSYF